MLKLPGMFGQRDSRWAGEYLGFNTSSPYTIGNYGCLITCLGCLINNTRLEVNTILKTNNGFISGGLFVWGKSTILGLNQLYVSPSYDGPVTEFGLTKAKEYLDQGYPLLLEVDFNPATIGEEMHFVLCLGHEDNQFTIFDPWTNSIRLLDDYGGFQRAVIQFRVYDVKLPHVEEQNLQVDLDKCRTARDSHWNDLNTIKDLLKIGGEYSLTVVRAEIEKLITYEDAVVVKDRTISDLEKQITELIAKVNAQNEALEHTNTYIKDMEFQYQAELESKTTEVSDMRKTVQTLTDENQSHLRALQELKTQCKPVFKGWKKKLYDLLLRG